MKNDKSSALAAKNDKKAFRARTWKLVKKNKMVYLMVLPVIIYYILFHYKPMYGIIIAFQDFRPRQGVLGSDWVGLKHFRNFFGGYYFGRLLGNTLKLSFATLLIGFPVPVILALLINELRSKKFSKLVQTITYMPHFVSMVVLCSMIRQFVESNGFITGFFTMFGYDGANMLSKGNLWIPIYVISNIWQGAGWGSIVYLAALTGIDSELYDAAKVDGANRWKQTLHVTIPALLLSGAVSTYNLIIMRTAMSGIDGALTESAMLDGAGHVTILFKILVPLCKATIAVLVLYYGVAHWNSWFNAMIYLKDSNKQPLQMVLRQILILSDMTDAGIGNADAEQLSETIKYATIIVSTLPILALYPFLQKYFTKGVMVGAVKG